MNSSPEFDFFKKTEESQVIESKLGIDEPSKLTKMAREGLWAVEIENTIGGDVIDVALASGIITVVGVFCLLMFWSIHFMSGAGVVASILTFFFMFRFMIKTVEKIGDNASISKDKAKFLETSEDLDFTINEFAKSNKIDVRYDFSDTFFVNLKVDVKIRNKWYKMADFSPEDVAENNSTFWIRKLNAGFEAARFNSRNENMRAQLDIIKKVDQAKWFSLAERSNAQEINEAYNNLINKS